MVARLIVFLPLLIMAIASQAQSPDRAERWLDWEYPGEIKAVITCYDGGLAGAGYVTDSFGRESFFLVKYDSLFQQEFARQFTFGNESVAYDLVQTLDSGFVLVGTGVNGLGGRDVALVRTDVRGDLVWGRLYGGSGEDEGNAVLLDPAGGYWIGGSTASFASSRDLYFIKVDFNGNLQSSSTYGGNFAEYLYGAAFSFEKGFFFACQTFSFTLSYDPMIIALDPQGNYRWSTVFPGSGIGTGRAVALEDTTVYLLSEGPGPTSQPNDIFLSELDNSGEPVHSYRMGSQGFSRGNSLLIRDGHFYISGFFRESGLEERPLILALDSMKRLEWSVAYGTLQEDLAWGLTYAGKRLVGVGATAGYHGGTGRRPWMVFTPEDGVNDCPALSLSMYEDTASLTFMHPQLSIQTTPNTQTFLPTISEGAVNLTDRIVCTLLASRPERSPADEALKLWPNPAYSHLNLEAEGLQEVRLYSAQGQLCKSWKGEGQDRLVLQVGDLPRGIYFVQIQSVGNQWVRRVILN